MASGCRKLFNRASVSSLKSALRSATGSSPAASSAGFRIPSQPSRQFSFSRCPSELGCVQTSVVVTASQHCGSSEADFVPKHYFKE